MGASWAVLVATLAPSWGQDGAQFANKSIRKSIKFLKLFQDRFLELHPKLLDAILRILDRLGRFVFPTKKKTKLSIEKPSFSHFSEDVLEGVFSFNNRPRCTRPGSKRVGLQNARARGGLWRGRRSQIPATFYKDLSKESCTRTRTKTIGQEFVCRI